MGVGTAISGVCIAAIVCGAAPAGAVDNSAARTDWATLLGRVNEWTMSAIDSGGLELRDSPRGTRFRIDFTTGYTRGPAALTAMSGESFTDATRHTDPKVLRLLGPPKVSWVQDHFSDPDWDLPTQVLALGRPTAVRSVESSSRDGKDTYTVRFTAGGPTHVTISPSEVVVGDTSWRSGPQHLAAPSATSVVSLADYWRARDALLLRQQARRAIRAARHAWISGERRITRIRHLVRAITDRVRLRNTPHGIVISAHNRYIHRTWRMALLPRSGQFRVYSIDHHRADWSPPREKVNIPAARATSPANREALDTFLTSIQQAEAQPGMTVDLEGDADTSPGDLTRLVFDDTSGLIGSFDQHGALMGIRNDQGFECARIETRGSAQMRRAVRRAGKPDARYSCNPSESDLVWAAILLRPGAVLARAFLGPSLTAMRTDDRVEVAWTTDRETLARLHFAGSYLIRADFLDAGDNRIGTMATSYRYGAVDLRMPPPPTRIGERLLADAVLSVRAPHMLAVAGRWAKACIARHRTLASAMTCVRRTAGASPDLRIRRIPAGVRLRIRTRFTLDTRDVIRTSSGAVRMRGVVHQVFD